MGWKLSKMSKGLIILIIIIILIDFISLPFTYDGDPTSKSIQHLLTGVISGILFLIILGVEIYKKYKK